MEGMDTTDDMIEFRLKGKPVPADVAKRNLDAVREALQNLGGRAFGASIVEYLCRNRGDMLRSFGGDKKRLRYCVNGLLSARVNATYFEKKVYKDNGSTKTEWFLTELYDENINILSDSGGNVKHDGSDRSSFSEDDDTERDEDDSTSSDSNANPMNSNEEDTPKSRRRRSTRQANALRKRPSSGRYSPDVVKSDDVRIKRIRSGTRDSDIEEEDCFDEMRAMAFGDEFEGSEGDFQTNGDTPLTYRGMIKVALESMGGHGTFESISKFIGVRFRDQLVNKAETWKHSIAGCLSVYFARREEKDASGKVIWTLEEPPKPKRRGRKRDRDDLSMNSDRDSYKETRSSAAKKRREEMVLISIEQLEALEEENECLKLLNVKKREEKHGDEHNTPTCSCCHERKELGLMLSPCGHLFCGSIFCEASTCKNCPICSAEVTQRLPHLTNRNSKSLKGIFDSLANAVMTTMMTNTEFKLANTAVMV